MTAVKKDVVKHIRMTKADEQTLQCKSKEYGFSESEYVRLLLSQKPNDYPEVRELLRNLINEVNHIGVNVNQIVHNNNAELYSEIDKEHLFAYMKKLNLAVKEAVMLLGNQ